MKKMTEDSQGISNGIEKYGGHIWGQRPSDLMIFLLRGQLLKMVICKTSKV